MGKKAPKPREKNVEVAVLNIKVHSTAPNKFERLFELISAVEHVKVRGTEFGTIGYLKKAEKDFLVGEIYLFLNIDAREPWYDAQKRIPIEPDAIGMETQVFDRLKPHLKQRAYVFDLRNHTFYVDSNGFSPNVARVFLKRLCEHAQTIQQIGEIDIEVHSTEESIDEILGMPNLTYLEVFVTLPNPVDLTETQQQLFRELQEEGIINVKEIKKSSKEAGITPRPRTRDLVYLSRTDGYTRAGGFIQDQYVVRHTEQHPKIVNEPYFLRRRSRQWMHFFGLLKTFTKT